MSSLRIALLAGVAVLALLLTPGVTSAQYYGGYYSGHSDSPYGPTTSPYLNLLQNNNPLNPVPSYNSLVRPFVDQGNALQRQGNALNRLQSQVGSGGGSQAVQSTGSTGHQSFFMNYSHYYGMRR